jgi:hypothetical protein
MNRNCLVVILTLGLAALCPVLRAQDHGPSIDSMVEMVRAGMQAEKAAIITTNMKLSDKDGAAFWPIYRQYERERSIAGDARVTVIKEYSAKYPELTYADAKAMAQRMFEYDSRIAALKKKYFTKFNRVLPALTVTKFFQLERRIDLLVDLKVESALPPLTLGQPPAAAQSTN